MHFSPPSLHHPVFTARAHKDIARDRLSDIAGRRRLLAPRLPRLEGAPIDIPLTTVSLATNFDAYIDIRFSGTSDESSVSLVVDSGNSSLIVPDFAALSALSNFSADYQILAHDVVEPWGCPANIVRGPINIPTTSGGIHEIRGCVFYACTGDNSQGDRTANFGTGCIRSWTKDHGIEMRAPLSYDPAYPYAEFNYAPVEQILARGTDLNIAEHSFLRLHPTEPSGYRTFDIIRDLLWMSLIPRSLSIGDVRTSWPGALSSPIAMVDTGGGPIFLSDPNGSVYGTHWPDQVPSPSWTSTGSVACQSTKAALGVTLSDESNSFSYRIDTANLPSSVRGLTLVMCQRCQYMMGQDGMNIGGLSALFNYVLIDYVSGKVGFKAKSLAVL